MATTALEGGGALLWCRGSGAEDSSMAAGASGSMVLKVPQAEDVVVGASVGGAVVELLATSHTSGHHVSGEADVWGLGAAARAAKFCLLLRFLAAIFALLSASASCGGPPPPCGRPAAATATSSMPPAATKVGKAADKTRGGDRGEGQQKGQGMRHRPKGAQACVGRSAR